jgi:hypothetical protein
LNQARDIGPSLETGPQEETARLLAARYFAEQGRQAAANDDLETAVVQYRQAIRIDPSFPVDAPEGEARRQNAGTYWPLPSQWLSPARSLRP